MVVGRVGALLQEEVRELLRSRSLWVMLVLLSIVTGYSFSQAVRLYGEASRSALPFPEMARAMTPLDGVLVPTFGAYYLVATLLFPFIAIRLIGGEKQSGSIKLLLQLPMKPSVLAALKALAVGLAWVVALLPALSALVGWRALGGHIYWPETLNLLAGHSLYALAIAGIAFFAAAVADSVSTAAIIALACTTGSWVLDFAAAGDGLLSRVSFLSLTAALRPFERGLFSLESALALAALGLGLIFLTGAWLGAAPRRRAALGLFAALAIAGVWTLGAMLNVSRDVTEDRRNSFPPAVELALRRLNKPLRITVRLSPEDSRLADLERNILDKLRRLVPKLAVVYADARRLSGQAEGQDDYGVIAYDYDGKREQSRSNSEEEILPILFNLSGQTVSTEAGTDYPGYPLVADTGWWEWWFYGVLPLIAGLGCWFNGRGAPMRWILGG
ncbi:MAG: ABC transporter permease subunit [Elusimicrobia bacterium]|nr:ABC transporter permease subunit [Elusimicrobiota bacterium]